MSQYLGPAAIEKEVRPSPSLGNDPLRDKPVSSDERKHSFMQTPALSTVGGCVRGAARTPLNAALKKGKDILD